MVNHCIHCGAELPDGRNFCLACGKMQRAQPVNVPVPRRRGRLVWPALLLAAVVACSPLLLRRHHTRGQIGELPGEKPGPAAENTETTEASRWDEDVTAGIHTVAEDLADALSALPIPAVEKRTEVPATSQTGHEMTPAPRPAEAAPTPDPVPEPPTETTPAAAPAPESEPGPAQAAPEPVFEPGTQEQLEHWISTARQASPASILREGVTYCIARPGEPGRYRVMFFRLQSAGDQSDRWWKLYRGIVGYQDYLNYEYDQACDTVLDGTTYHFNGDLIVTTSGVSGYWPTTDHMFMFVCGGTVIETYLSESGAITGGPILGHYGTYAMFNGDLGTDVELFRNGTLIPCSDPGLLRAVDYAIALHDSNG